MITKLCVIHEISWNFSKYSRWENHATCDNTSGIKQLGYLNVLPP
jgi:hypothetical protein